MTRNQEGTHNQELLPEKQRFHTPNWAPQLLRLEPEREALKHLALKTNGAHICDTQKAIGNGEMALK